MRLIPRLSRDASSYSDSSNTTEGSSTPSEMAGVTATATEQFLRPRPELAPYEVPPSDGSSRLLTCPPEVLVGIFSRLDRGTFTTCMRVCHPPSNRRLVSSRLMLVGIAMPHDQRAARDQHRVKTASYLTVQFAFAQSPRSTTIEQHQPHPARTGETA